MIHAAALPVLTASLLSASVGGGTTEHTEDSIDHIGCLHCMQARMEAMGGMGARRGVVGWRTPHFDAETGANLNNYPPDRRVDHVHMRLNLDIKDMNVPEAEALAMLRMRPVGRPLDVLTLSVGPGSSTVIHDVEAATPEGEHALSFSHDHERLSITFDPPVEVGADTTVAITYTLKDPPEGLMWTPETPAWPDRPAQIHTQGQAEANHYWFPTHDFPNEKITTELLVTVPDDYVVSSNGRLVEKTSPADGYAQFHWLQDTPHSAYLVTLIVGQFDIADVGGKTDAGRIPMPVYVPPGKGHQIKQTYGRTLEMTRVFEDLFDEPYPWDRYAQLVVHNFAFGGMENTGATTMFDTAILDRTSLMDGNLDALISHELAHQWFGDLITCKSWEHLWLNEGFATYLESLWYEQYNGRDEYEYDVYNNMTSVIRSDKAQWPEHVAMVSPSYAHPVETLFKPANPYSKGCSVLHMVRERLGEAPDGNDLFFPAVAEYLDRHKYTTVETYEFRRALEDVSGLALERFFDQWTRRPGVPYLDMDFAMNDASISIRAEQTQNIDPANPAFALDMPILVVLEGGDTTTVVLRGDTTVIESDFDLPGKPVRVVVDPDMTTLARIATTQPELDFIAQLNNGPTMFARLRAADTLGDSDSLGERAAEALVAVARDRDEHYGLRMRCIKALSNTGRTDDLLAMGDSQPRDARVRNELMKALGSIASDEELRGTLPTARAAGFVREAAKSDESYAVRSSAIRTIGHIATAEDAPTIMGALETESQHDQIRRAAIDAIATVDDPGGLNLVVRYAAPGTNSSTRTNAVRAIRKLGHHSPDHAFNILAALVNDRELRTSRAAMMAVAALGDERGIALLERSVRENTSTLRRFNAQQALDELRASLESTETAAGN